MKFGTVLLTIFFSLCALGGIVWLGYVQPISVKEDERLKQQGSQPAPEIAVSGPQPKAVADETVFMFGQSYVGVESSHVFILKNEGKVPLTLTKGESTCQCMISSLENNAILPGESAEITLKWNPKKSDFRFVHSAEIITNDPKSKIITFQIEGEVLESIMTIPNEVWSMPDIIDREPTKFFGYVFAPGMEDFQIEKIITSNPLLTAKYFKLSDTELKQVHLENGYRIDLELKQGVPLGQFSETLTIITNLKDVELLTVSVCTHRYGPITFLHIKNCGWKAGKRELDMGDFAASDGRISTLLLFVNNIGDKELKFRDIEVDPEYLKITFNPDDSYTGKGPKRYLLTVEIPPGSPRGIRRNESAAHVRLKTNHPDVPELTFHVRFNAR